MICDLWSVIYDLARGKIDTYPWKKNFLVQFYDEELAITFNPTLIINYILRTMNSWQITDTWQLITNNW